MNGNGNANGNGHVALKGFGEIVPVTHEFSELFEVIQPLTQQQRLDARTRAVRVIERIAGDKPQRSQFKNSTVSKYPHWITALVVSLSMVVLLTAFVLSAMRLYHIGNATFYETLSNETSAKVAGYAIVLLSEAAAVLFTIALSVIGQSKTQRRILLCSVFASAALALSGNYYVALDGRDATAFSVLESMLPPLMTLSTAYVLKELLLNIIQQRHADQMAFDLAVIEWEAARANPENHPNFEQAYANELRDMLVKVNRRKVAKDIIPHLDVAHWRALVEREKATEDWFSSEVVGSLPLA